MSKKFFIFCLTLFFTLFFIFSQFLNSFAALQFEYKEFFLITQDLVINSISFKPEAPEQGDKIAIIVEIENKNASSTCSEINLEVRLNDEVIGRSGVLTLKPKEKTKRTIYYTLPQSLTGKVTFEVILNPPEGPKKLASVNVSSKGGLVTPFIIKSIDKSKLMPKLIKKFIDFDLSEEEGKPNLTITDVSFTPADPITPDQIFIDIEIKNQGDGPAIFPPGATIWSATRPQGDGVGERLPQGQGMSIAPDETYHGGCTFIEPGEVETGTYTINVKVDPENRVEESEEENNESIYYLTIWEEPKPDLTITDVSFRPADPSIPDQIFIDIEIKNQGDGSAIFPPGATIWSATRPQGGGVGERLPQEERMSIAPDETYEGAVTFIEPGEVEAGTYTIEVKVDPENQVEESEEENNESIYYLTIWEEPKLPLEMESLEMESLETESLEMESLEMKLLPDLMVENVHLSGLREGGLPKVWVKIKNAGEADVTRNFKFRVQLNGWEDVFEVRASQEEPRQSGEVIPYPIRVPTLQPGENLFRISLDIEEEIDEFNEDNNEVTIPVTWSPPEVTTRMADLSIEGFYTEPSQLVEGEHQCIYVVARNSGDASPETLYSDTSPESIRVILYYKGEGETDWNLFKEPRRGFINIGPRENLTFSFSREALFALPAGDYLFRGLVDEWAVLRDRNFQNNVMEEEISIAPSPILVRSFSPSRTAWGARILLEISTGRNLLDPAHPVSLSVRFGELEGVVENILKRSHPDYTLAVVVPEGATSGPVSVSAYGVTGTSRYSLAIFGPPTVTEISPQACPVGSTITIRGTNFVPPTYGTGEGTVVEFASSGTAEGRRQVSVRAHEMSETEIQVRVPLDAVSGPLTVETIVGDQLFSITSETPLRVLPKINSASPNRGHVGDSIKLYGTSFGFNPQVEFNGVQAEVVGSIPNIPVGRGVKVRVPEGARTGKIRVITDEGSAESEEDFRVLTGPTINSISPQIGPEGTLVTIEGVDLDFITSGTLIVSHGRSAWGFRLEIVDTPTRNYAQLRIPTGINLPGTAEIFVRSPGPGEGHHSNRVSFELTVEGMILRTPQIERFQPFRSTFGATVILIVKYLPNPQPELVTVAFNGVPGETEEIIDRGIYYEVYVQIPEGATTGPITLTTYNVTATSSSNISIFGPPTITEISPPSARRGEYITIRGTNFLNPWGEERTLVYFNTAGGGSREVIPALQEDETELRLRVPPEAVTGPLTITTLIAGRSYSTTSEMEFIVEAD